MVLITIDYDCQKWFYDVMYDMSPYESTNFANALLLTHSLWLMARLKSTMTVT